MDRVTCGLPCESCGLVGVRCLDRRQEDRMFSWTEIAMTSQVMWCLSLMRTNVRVKPDREDLPVGLAAEPLHELASTFSALGRAPGIEVPVALQESGARPLALQQVLDLA